MRAKKKNKNLFLLFFLTVKSKCVVKKVNRKTVFAVAYIVCALIAFGLFFNYSYSQYEEYDAIQRAKWIARGWSAELYDGYVREGIGATVYGRNVTNFGLVLIFGGLIGAFVLTTISGVLNERRAREKKKDSGS
jgi:uncharacterized membrane protein (DUF485 family)